MPIDDINEQQKIRREKALELKELGVDPFGSRFERTNHAKDIIDTYDKYDHDQLEELQKEVIIAGRIVLKRVQGKAGFIHILDQGNKIQSYIRLDAVGEFDFEIFKKSDLGDIVGIKGVLFRTRTNELTVKASKFTHLTKALTPLPDKYHGLQDKEEARRRRYVDLIVNERSREVAIKRTKIIRAFQHYFDSHDFIEVETPVLQPILGGAAARPFITHHNTLDMDFYLKLRQNYL